MEREQIILDVETGVNDAPKANADLAAVERQAQKTGDTVVRVSDRSRNSIERLVASAEKQAAVYGKTGTERLVAQRDMLISRLNGEEKAIARVNAAYAKMIDAQRAQETQANSFADRVRSAVQNPMQAASEAAEGLANKLGIVGVSLLGIAAAAGVAAKASYNLVQHYADEAEKLQNLADRTGLSIKEAEQYSEASKMAGVNVEGLVAATRRMAEALSETSTAGARGRAALRDLKVEARDAYGNLKPTGQLIREIGAAVAMLPDQSAKLRTLTALFGRGGSELLPVFKELPETLKYLDQIGVGMDASIIQRLAKADKTLDRFWVRWRLFWKEFAANVASSAGPEAANRGIMTRVSRFMASAGFVLSGAEPVGPTPPKIGDPDAALAGSVERQRRTRFLEYMGSRQGANTLQERLKDAQERRDMAASEYNIDAHRRAESEVRMLERQLGALKDAERKAADIEKQAVKVREILNNRKAQIAAAAMGAELQIVATDRSADENYRRSMDYRAQQFSDRIQQQIRWDEDTIDQLRKTQDHLAKLDEEALADREEQARKYAEIAEREFDRVRSAFEGLFDSAFAGARSFWDGMKRFAYTMFLTPVKMELANMFAGIWTGHGPQAGGQSGGGFFARSLFNPGGLFGGGNPASMIGPGGTAPFAGGSLRHLSSGAMGLPILAGGGTRTGGVLGGIGASNLGMLGVGAGVLGGFGAFKLGQSGSPLRYGAPALGAAAGLFGFGGLSMLFPSLVAAGPAGWIAAAGIGAFVGMLGLFKKSAEQKAREKIKAAYGIDVKDKGVLQQIVATAKQSFGGNIDVAIYSPQIRDLIELYAMSTGQNIGPYAKVRPVSLVQSRGNLYQDVQYENGRALAYSGLPTWGGIPAAPIPTNTGGVGQPTPYSTGQPVMVVLQVNGEGANAVLRGEIAPAIMSNPRPVAAAVNKSAAQNSNRQSIAAKLISPGDLTA